MSVPIPGPSSDMDTVGIDTPDTDALARALGALGGLDDMPVAGHVAVFESVHDALVGHMALGED